VLSLSHGGDLSIRERGSVNLLELLVFLLICLGLGFLAHLIFPAWGWYVGAAAALALMLLMLFAMVWDLFSRYQRGTK
jgi:hypothetical protein